MRTQIKWMFPQCEQQSRFIRGACRVQSVKANKTRHRIEDIEMQYLFKIEQFARTNCFFLVQATINEIVFWKVFKMPLRCFQPRTFLKYQSLPFAIAFFPLFFKSKCVGVLIRTEKWAKRKWQRFGNENQIQKKNTQTRKNEDENDLDSIPCSYFHCSVEFSITFFFESCGSHFLTHSPILKRISVWFPHFSFWPKNRLMFQRVFIFLFEVTASMMWFSFSLSLLLSFQMEDSCSWKPFFFRITLFWCI